MKKKSTVAKASKRMKKSIKATGASKKDAKMKDGGIMKSVSKNKKY